MFRASIEDFQMIISKGFYIIPLTVAPLRSALTNPAEVLLGAYWRERQNWGRCCHKGAQHPVGPRLWCCKGLVEKGATKEWNARAQ